MITCTVGYVTAQEDSADRYLGSLTTTSAANIRSEPNTSSSVVARVNAGTEFNITEVVEDGELYNGNAVWYGVLIDEDQSGFVWSGLTQNVIFDFCRPTKSIAGLITFDITEEYTTVYGIEPNGCNLRQLISQELLDKYDLEAGHQSISWSADGQTAVFSYADTRLQAFYIDRVNKTDQQLIFQSGSMHESPFTPQLTPDGKTVVICSQFSLSDRRGIGVRTVEEDMNYRLYTIPSMNFICPPAIASNAKFVVVPAIATLRGLSDDFSNYAPEIWLLNLETTDKQPIGQGHRAAWSPTNEQFAYAGYAENAGAIYLYNVNRSELSQLTPANSEIDTHRTNLAWSHDGQAIAYYGLQDGTGGIFVVNLDTLVSQRITPNEIDFPAFQLAWSPDDQYIAFLTATDTSAKAVELFVVEVASGNVHQLVRMPAELIAFVILDSFDWIPY
jgi:Tol biopolymer transport system component